MKQCVVHIVDVTTPPDAFGQLAALLAASDTVAVLGHHSSGRLASAAGVPGAQLIYLPSMGWADPTGWRALGRIIRKSTPGAVHAWGIPAAFAAAMSTSSASARQNYPAPARFITLFDLPSPKNLRLLPAIHRGGIQGAASLLPFHQTAQHSSPFPACQWIAASAWLRRELSAHGIPADTVAHIRPGIIAAPSATDAAARHLRSPELLREELGLFPGDGPILLLGGEGSADSVLSNPDPLAPIPVVPTWNGGPRHDLGLWSTAVVQQVFPHIRVIVREDPRDRINPGLERLMNHLPDDNILAVASADYSWRELLSLADALLVTPDQPFASVGPGSLLTAMASGVPVIGTPMECVREWIRDGETGVLTASAKPRAISAAIEAFLGETGAESRKRVIAAARAEAEAVYSKEKMRQEYEALSANSPHSALPQNAASA